MKVIPGRTRHKPVKQITDIQEIKAEMLAEIMDTPADAGDGSAKSHTIWISKELLKPHINNLRMSVIDGYKAGNLRNFLVFHNGYRRMFEISIESVHNDSVSERIADFAQRRQRMEI